MKVEKMGRLIFIFLIILVAAMFYVNFASAKQSKVNTTFLVMGHVYPDYEALNLSIFLIEKEKPDFVVFLGDSVYEGGAWEELLVITDKINVPIYFTPGNHDLGANLEYEDYFIENISGFLFRKFVVKDNIFIILNSVGRQGNYDISEEQVDFIKNIYNESGNKNKVIFMHHCLFYQDDGKFCNSRGNLISKKSNWNNLAIPIIRNKTSAVFIGDSGMKEPYFSYNENNISYFGIGFSREKDGLKNPQHILKVTINVESIEIVPIMLRQDLTKIINYPNLNKSLIFSLKLFILNNLKVVLITLGLIVFLFSLIILYLSIKLKMTKVKN